MPDIGKVILSESLLGYNSNKWHGLEIAEWDQWIGNKWLKYAVETVTATKTKTNKIAKYWQKLLPPIVNTKNNKFSQIALQQI